MMRAIYGRNSVGTIPRMETPACLIWVDGLPQIIVRSGARDVNFLIAHEMAHIALRTAEFDGTRADEERAADAIAAAILAPPRAVLGAHRFFGERLRPLARCFAISQTSMTLRLGEVLNDERAVVTRNRRILKRGWEASDDQLLLRWRNEPAPPGIAKVRLVGKVDHDRVAFRKIVTR